MLEPRNPMKTTSAAKVVLEQPTKDTHSQGGWARWKPGGLRTALLLALVSCFCCAPLFAQSLSPSGPIVINGQNGTVIHGLKITSASGDCLQIVNSTNITVENSEIGPCGGNAVKISGGDGINIFDNYIHPETLNAAGCCDHNDGIFALGTSNLTVQGNVIAYSESNIEVKGGNRVSVIGNFLLNPRGPFPRGQNFQCWKDASGNVCTNVTVEDNYALSSMDTTKYLYPENQEDSISFGPSNGIIARNNYITGGHSSSGCGLIADKLANSAQFLSNRLLDTGQCGIGITDGTNQLVDSNEVLNRTPVTGGGNTAIYVWQPKGHAGDPCGPVTVSNNMATEYKPSGTQSGFWKGAGCDPLTLTNNVFGQPADAMLTSTTQASAALSSVGAVLAPPSIPPQPKNCAVPSPYSNQTVWSACRNGSAGLAVTAVSPNSGATAGGTPVLISGSNFQNGATVLFGNSDASNVTVTSSGGITAITPAGVAGASVNVTVRNTDGTSATLPSAFSYTATTTSPTVNGVSPNTGLAIGGTAVTISGSNFRSGATVLFGGANASKVAVLSSGGITAITPAGVAGASVNVTVRNSDGTSATLPSAYSYTATTTSPTVNGVRPNTGLAIGGTAVTISGSNFRSGATVLFGGANASSVNVVSSSSITVMSPAGSAGSNVNVTVHNTDGTTATMDSAYSYTTIGGAQTSHYEYVFTDGTLYVYDLDTAGFPLVKSKNIPTTSGTRGAVACTGNSTLYLAIGGDGGAYGNGGLLAYDLLGDAVLWTQNYSHAIDSHAITPDCTLVYMPGGELANTDAWYVIDARNGNEIGTISGSQASHPHNTVVYNGHVYLGGRQSTLFQSANVSDNTVYFTSSHGANTIRPFTINAEETAAYITETNFLGFEQVNLKTGAISFSVPVSGFSTGCSRNCPSTPSHGISMSPDERWLYVLDSINGYVHVFDISGGVNVRPAQKYDVKLNHTLLSTESSCAYDCLGDGWLHHSFDGRYVFVGDSGDVIATDVQNGYANPPAVVGFLPQMKNSRKEIEIDFQNGSVVAAMTNRSSIGTGAK